MPGPVTSPASAGCHRLLRERGAVCVTAVDEAAELLGPAGVTAAVPVVARRPFDGLDPDELKVAESLPRRGVRSTEQLVRDSGLDSGTVLAALGRLELAGTVGRADGGWCLAVRV